MFGVCFSSCLASVSTEEYKYKNVHLVYGINIGLLDTVYFM